jgi:hypothetical protein
MFLCIYIPKGLPSFLLEMLGNRGDSIAQNVDIVKTKKLFRGRKRNRKPQKAI